MEEIKIYQMKDAKGNLVAPKSPEKAIFDENGIRLDIKLKGLNLEQIKDAQNSAIDLINETKDTSLQEINNATNGIYTNTGVNEYEEFSESKPYDIGDVVKKDGLLYKFTSVHIAGPWTGKDVEPTSIKNETDNKLIELGMQGSISDSQLDNLIEPGIYQRKIYEGGNAKSLYIVNRDTYYNTVSQLKITLSGINGNIEISSRIKIGEEAWTEWYNSIDDTIKRVKDSEIDSLITPGIYQRNIIGLSAYTSFLLFVSRYNDSVIDRFIQFKIEVTTSTKRPSLLIRYTDDNGKNWTDWINYIDNDLNALQLKSYYFNKSTYEGNLIDPNKVIPGYYCGEGGALTANESYGYIYIPMRGKNITLNYGGGFGISAYDKYGNVTHSNLSNAEVVEGRTIKYQDGDEYAMISVRLADLGKSASAEYGDITPTYKPYFGQDGASIKNNSISIKKLDKSILIKKNLLDPDDPDYYEGYYLTSENNLAVNENYAVSGYIPFTEEMGKLIMSRDGKTITDGGGGVALYDIDKNLIEISQNQELRGVVSWKDKVAFARFSINKYKEGNNQIEVGDIPTKYESPNGKINSNLISDILLSSLGNNADSITKDVLNDSETLTLDKFPWHIKKGLIMSFSASVTSFSSILIGKGLNQYRGNYLKIDSTNITQLQYEQSEIEIEKVAHGLSIDTFIKLSLFANNSGHLYVILQSKDKTFKYTFKNWGYEVNYTVFVKSINSILTDLKLNAGCQDFKLPVWAFGDSYFGVTNTRWIGAIKDFGFFNFFIDGLAGQNSNGAYNDLLKCLQFGAPKYLLWCLGMNDTDSDFISIFNKVKSLCESKGIILIAATIPTVPELNKEVISQYVRDSGLRYIDFYKAMGTNSKGTWYDGYLSPDNVHPTELGATVLAMQVLVDFPELMQYGLFVE